MNLRAFSGAALLASVTLVLPAAAVVHAAPAAPGASAAARGTGDPGVSRSRTPELTRVKARVAGSDPAAAARSFLAARSSTYHISDPARDLRTVSHASENGVTTVRLAQRYRGLPVVGAQYVVRMKDEGASNLVSGTSGQYFSELGVDTSHPLGFAPARRAALHWLTSTVRWRGTPSVTDHGSAVVPVGKGVLTRHVTVSGYDNARRTPVRQQMYIHAHTGKPVMSFNDLQFDGPVSTTGPSVNGGSVPLEAFQDAATYQLRDHSRDMFVAPDQGEIVTRDAKGGDFSLYLDEEMPPRTRPVQSSTVPFPVSPKAGANDAHWGLGQIYEFYRDLGRNSIDGKGGTINAVVGVTDFGSPFPNAFWNGAYMVFGAGGYGYKPFSSSLDVVGHELTHGVVQYSDADLMYVGQSGATNEAVADYLGNAAQNRVEGIGENSPLDGLLGDRLCAGGPRLECFDRDLNEPMTTKDFVSTPEDNGGVHLNSTIVSGSWWQIRHELGADRADALVYKTLTQYLTPSSQFLDVRNATVAAAQDSGYNEGGLATVRQAFTDHGIVDDWEVTDLGADFHPLHEILGYPFIYPRVANGSWYASDLATPEDFYPSIVTGSLTGAGEPTRISPADDQYYDNPDSDGTSVVWTRTRDTDERTYIQRRPVAGGPVVDEDFVPFPFVWNVRVSGKTIVYTLPDLFGEGDTAVVLRPDGGSTTLKARSGRTVSNVDVRGNKVVYAVSGFAGRKITIKEYDSVSGLKRTLGVIESPRGSFMADLNVEDHHIAFQLDKHPESPRSGIVVMNRDGSARHWLIKDTEARAPMLPMLTATDEAVSFTSVDFDTEWLDTYLRQLPYAGGATKRVSCSNAYKGAPASDSGTGVTWVDFTGGRSQIVNRETPVGSCG